MVSSQFHVYGQLFTVAAWFSPGLVFSCFAFKYKTIHCLDPVSVLVVITLHVRLLFGAVCMAEIVFSASLMRINTHL